MTGTPAIEGEIRGSSFIYGGEGLSARAMRSAGAAGARAVVAARVRPCQKVRWPER